MVKKFWLYIFVTFLVFFAYRVWFSPGGLGAHDFPYIYPERIIEYGVFPPVWQSLSGNGLGGVTTASLNFDTYVHPGIALFGNVLHLPWSSISRILFFFPFLAIGLSGSFYFSRSLIGQSLFAPIGALIYMTNTYILMISGGGQVGIMLAYAVAPYVLGSFIAKNKSLFAISGILLCVFDIRYAYIIFGSLILYALLCIPFRLWRNTINYWMPALIWILIANLYWLIPLVKTPAFALPSGYDNPQWLSFLSWADFSKTISLLHPHWPENIFGKTYFLRPEFLFIPIVGFGFLLLAKQDGEGYLKKRHIAYFGLLAILGAFLAKGVKPPFEQIYSWMFEHMPLFSGFRDPTKFYVLVALAYSYLLPLSLGTCSQWVTKKWRLRNEIVWRVSIVCFFAFWMFLLSPLFAGEVDGTFNVKSVPTSYEKLRTHLWSDFNFGRVMALPRRQRFLYEAQNHPVLDAQYVFQTTDHAKLLASLVDPKTQNILKRLAVSYIVVPQDTDHEIFLKDRTHDAALRQLYIKTLDGVSYLTKVHDFSELAVYKVNAPVSHIFRTLENGDFELLEVNRHDGSTYSIWIPSTNRPITITFSEAYDPRWELFDGKSYIKSTPTPDGLNSFVIDTIHTTKGMIRYKGALDFTYARYATLVLIVCLVLFFGRKKKRFVAGLLFLFLVLLTGAYLVQKQKTDPNVNALTSSSVYYSPGWVLIQNPVTRETYRGSRFGGSTISFHSKGTGSIDLQIDSNNKIEGEQVLRIQIDDDIRAYSSPFSNTNIEIPVKPAGSDVEISLICNSSLIPCDVHITKLAATGRAVIETPKSKPKPTLGILGDSISTSYGLNNFSVGLAQRLGYQLHNASVFGASLTYTPNWHWGYNSVVHDILPYKPDVLLIFLGTNDIGRGVPQDEFRKTYRQLLVDIKEKSPDTQIVAVGILNRFDLPQQSVRLYHGIIEQEARRAAVQFIDPYYFLSYTDYSDVIHPSESAQKKLEDAFYKILVSEVNKTDVP